MYNPGYFKIDKNKIKRIIEILNLDKDDIKSLKRNLKMTKNTLKLGDMQLSKIISVDPLLISCYTDEFDAVLIYEYPNELVYYYNLKINQLLISSNSYWPKNAFDIEEDIIPGNDCSNEWRDVICFIPLFLCLEIQEQKSLMYVDKLYDEKLLKHMDELTTEYLIKKPNQIRKGFKTLIKY